MKNIIRLSIVIPSYNNAHTVALLLTSLIASTRAPWFEVIVVDDGSSMRITEKSLGISKSLARKLRLRILRLTKNAGPAIARNKGAKYAKGDFLVFLDADVEVFSDTLYEIMRVYRDDPDVVALTGVWVKQQKTSAFFPNFKALRDWSYWINERDKSGYYFLFSTRIASIKRAVFMRLGGFDETYPAPLVEDIELTYRIARRYAIIFAPKVRVRHEFESFYPVARKYFLRTYYWTKLYASRKRFDPVATTLSEAITGVTGAGVCMISVGWIVPLFLFPWIPHVLEIYGSIFVAVLLLHILLVRKFLVFVAEEKGIVFAMKSFVVGVVLYTVIVSGAIASKIH